MFEATVWTDEKVRELRLYLAEGYRPWQVARLMNLPTTSVYRKVLDINNTLPAEEQVATQRPALPPGHPISWGAISRNPWPGVDPKKWRFSGVR